MSARESVMRAAMAVAGLASLLLSAGPMISAAVAQTPTSAPAPDSAPAPAPDDPAYQPIRLQPVRLVYRQMEGTYLKSPRGVFYDKARDEIYVADTMNDLVAVYSREGTALFAFGYNGEFKEPVKAVVDGKGRIYVLAGVGRKLKVFSYRGEYLHDFPFHGVEGKAVPTTITADTEGQIYIADSASGQILVYDSDERLLRRFGTGRGDDRFDSIQALTVDRQRNIYVAGGVGVPIQVFAPDGKFLRSWGDHNIGPQNFSLPGGVAVDGAGRVAVVDTIRQVLSVFTPEGGFMDRFGGLGFAPGAMAFPADVASDGERLYIVERDGNRLQIMEEQPIKGNRPAPVAARPMPVGTREDLKRALGDLLRDFR